MDLYIQVTISTILLGTVGVIFFILFTDQERWVDWSMKIAFTGAAMFLLGILATVWQVV